MSLLSSLILPHVEKTLIEAEPQIAAFILNQLKLIAADVISWAESRAHLAEPAKNEEIPQ